jgi:ABC-type multidrug transport system fused ATPase/permease subunit
MTLRQIFIRYKTAIATVIVFVLIENIAWIIEPTFFGQLLDALIDDFYNKEHVDFVTPLAIWIVIYLINAFGGTLSRYFSGKKYAQIYADIAVNMIVVSRKKGYSMTKTLARAELAKEYIVFLKERLPEVSWQVTATFGAVVALFFYDWRIAVISLLVLIPMAIINRKYRNTVTKLQKDIHDTREDIYRVVESKNDSRISEYFLDMVAPQTRIAKWNSFNYIFIKVFLMIIFIAVLFICVDVDKFSTGKIYSVVAYIWTFISSAEYLPGLMESIASVRELSIRLKEEEV